MIDLKFIQDANAPYGFTILPKDEKSFEKTLYTIHLDSQYVRFSIFVFSRCIHYLFDKNKNYISWKQRQKEIENLEIEEKVLADGYKVLRKREVLIVDDEYKDGREYIIDTLYLNDEFQTSKREIELYPIDKIYTEYIDIKKSQNEYKQERKTNEALYLDSSTSKEKKIEILYEEVSCQTAMLAYHPMIRDSDKLYDMRYYSEYKKYYYSKVSNIEENYIEYLKAYFAGLRESAIDDIEGKEELKIIKELCKKAKLLDVFNEYMKNLTQDVLRDEQ